MRVGKIGQGAIATIVLFAIVGCNTATTPDATSPVDSATASPVAVADLPADDTILQTVYDQEASLNLCDGFFQPEVANMGSRVYVMGDHALVELECTLAAYQAVYAYVVYQPDGTLHPLTMDVFYPDQAGQLVRTSEATVAGLSTFDPEQGVLTVFSKARGVGDCGSLADYRWTGSELELETYRYKGCDDSTAESVDPTDYPQVYP